MLLFIPVYSYVIIEKIVFQRGRKKSDASCAMSQSFVTKADKRARTFYIKV